MLSTFIKLPFVIKVIVLSIFEWLLKAGFTVFFLFVSSQLMTSKVTSFMSLDHLVVSLELFPGGRMSG